MNEARLAAQPSSRANNPDDRSKLYPETTVQDGRLIGCSLTNTNCSISYKAKAVVMAEMDPSIEMKISSAEAQKTRLKKKYVPAVTPRLRIALMMVFILFALLAANSIYLSGITALEYYTGLGLQDYFYQCMFLLHLLLGVLILLPFMIFAYYHLIATRRRKNRNAVRVGYVLLAICSVLLISGILLTRIPGSLELKQPQVRQVVYWAHVITPLLAIWMYIIHRLAGPPIKWQVGLSYGAAVGLVVGVLIFLKLSDPRDFAAVGSPSSATYYQPSNVLTRNGNFIPQKALMNDTYCLECHKDVYEDFSHSAHRFSSFNNPAYLMSVEEVRRDMEQRDGTVKASRFCAGCHDPVPFLTGKFDDPNFDVTGKDPTAHAAITCTVCHSITSVGNEAGEVVGNADYSIEEPIHYPFAYSENPLLKWVNHQLVKAKPSFHKKMMLKPMHKSDQFCATCHKVNLPKELNQYKDWLRGQNHADTYHLSGVSGHGIRSFYYPPMAQTNCNECHMPRKESTDFGAIENPETKKMEVHNHLFPSANTAMAWWNHDEKTVQEHQNYLKNVMKIDIFGLKEDGRIDGNFLGPIRPSIPVLQPGKTYLMETIIRTMKMGHPFTQGTADSNEVWMEFTAIENAEFDASGTLTAGKILGKSGGMDSKGEVDPWSHFVNAFVLDRNGDRIDRRNAHDIFTPLYNHQIPPGAAQIVHYKLSIPENVTGPVTVVAKLNYRKFDWVYLKYIHDYHREKNLPLRGLRQDGIVVNELPITKLAEDRVVFPIDPTQTQTVIQPDVGNQPLSDWMRWNDYGIGLMITASSVGSRGELRQAEAAFKEVEKLGRFDGPLNLARIYESEGSLDLATDALARAESMKIDETANDSFPHWTHAWLTGMVNREQGNYKQAAQNLQLALEFTSPSAKARKFDFTQDYFVRNQLAETLFDLAKQYQVGLPEREALLGETVQEYGKVLKFDSENATAHYGLYLLHQLQGETELAAKHQALHQKYKEDDNARDVAINIARKQYPAANHAAEAVVIYDLHRPTKFESSVLGGKLGEGVNMESNTSSVKVSDSTAVETTEDFNPNDVSMSSEMILQMNAADYQADPHKGLDVDHLKRIGLLDASPVSKN